MWSRPRSSWPSCTARWCRAARWARRSTRGRKHLHEQPVREIVEKLTLQDWLVPIVYEAQAMQVFTPPPHDARAGDQHHGRPAPRRSAATLDAALPAEPDAGFFGRDETLLALDRGFDRQHVVLLHAFAGSGKTTRRRVCPLVRADRRRGRAGAVELVRAAPAARRSCSTSSGGCSTRRCKRAASSGTRSRPGPEARPWRCKSCGRCRCCGSGTTSSRSPASRPAPRLN